jgi:hypothetical protein
VAVDEMAHPAIDGVAVAALDEFTAAVEVEVDVQVKMKMKMSVATDIVTARIAAVRGKTAAVLMMM